MEADKPWGGVWLLAAITADLLLCLLGNKFVDRVGAGGQAEVTHRVGRDRVAADSGRAQTPDVFGVSQAGCPNGSGWGMRKGREWGTCRAPRGIW